MSEDNPNDNEDQCRVLHQTLAELGLIQSWKDYVLHTSPAQTEDEGVAPSLEFGLLRGSNADEGEDDLPISIPIGVRVSGKDDRHYYANVVSRAGGSPIPMETSLQVPDLNWNPDTGLVTIQYEVKDLPNGLVELSIYRRVSEMEAELLLRKEMQLNKTRISGREIFYEEIYLRSLIGAKAEGLAPGTVLIYAVRPA